MRPRLLALACWVLLSVAVAGNANGGPIGAGGGFAAGHTAGFTWSGRPGTARGVAHINRVWWRSGHWWQGVRGHRFGWWWVVGPAWYWYPAAAYPYPDFSTPPYLPSGYWYWCDFYLNYYPDVADCPTGWQAVPAFNGALP